MSRRSVLVLLAATGAAGAILRHRRAVPRIEVFLDDGSRRPVDPGSPEGRRLLAAAGRALAAAGPA